MAGASEPLPQILLPLNPAEVGLLIGIVGLWRSSTPLAKIAAGIEAKLQAHDPWVGPDAEQQLFLMAPQLLRAAMNVLDQMDDEERESRVAHDLEMVVARARGK